MSERLVGDQVVNKILQARTAQGALVAVGRCVSYCDAPTVTIVSADGTRTHWRADMCQWIDIPEDVANALVP